MSDGALFESGRLGRLAVIRLRPNQDLVEGVEAVCHAHGIRHALVRSAVGSLVDAALGYGDCAQHKVTGPGVEILTLAGEVRPGAAGAPRADLRGTISDSLSRIYGGVFLRRQNAICITLELVLQEWFPDERKD